MARANYLTNPLLDLAAEQSDTTMLGHELLREITLDPPTPPPAPLSPPPVPSPPAVPRAGIDW